MASPAPAAIETRLFINNEFIPAVSGKTFDTVRLSRARRRASAFALRLPR
jgi:hypothetical protein